MRVVERLPPLQPSTLAKLFGVGATVGPVVDSLHNQCLLRYEYAPLVIPSPFDDSAPLLASSWAVPPLLGFAYVVLGAVLPRLVQWIIINFQSKITSSNNDSFLIATSTTTSSLTTNNQLRTKAIMAVLSTAAIIKLSEYLEVVHPLPSSVAQVGVLLLLALSQWALLDGTTAALWAASVTSIGGPLSELPFVAHHMWEYLPQAGDYFPLAGLSSPNNNNLQPVLTSLLGDDYASLALSSITGPCYFAVTMDAIALGRWFDGAAEEEGGLEAATADIMANDVRRSAS